MKVDGTCFCGNVRFEAEIDPDTVELCHCKDCQKISSSAFRIVVPALPGTFHLLSGTLTTFVKTAESGNKRDLAFCPTCGTAIYSAPAGGGPGFFGLRAGTLRQVGELVPRRQYWRRSALAWVDHVAEIESHESE
ncbi:GFA family protein [Aestuariivirga sp.]|uniref:GFA family protein n=1 Tax=Aestuariivirga sp. TaxID=2650926 RepID=UPI00391BF112